jgi:hypothetical protein
MSDRMTYGALLETFVLAELLKLASWNDEQLDFFHFRDRYDNEVDIVIEDSRGHVHVVGIEVKAAATVTQADFSGLRKLDEAGTWPNVRRSCFRPPLGTSLFGPSVEQNAPVRHQLIQKVEVRDVTGQNRPAQPAPLQKNQSVVETFTLGTCGVTSQSKQNPGENTCRSPRLGVWRHEPMYGNISNSLPNGLERTCSSRIYRAQPTKRVSQLRETYCGMIAGPQGYERIEGRRRSTLQRVNVDRRIQ